MTSRQSILAQLNFPATYRFHVALLRGPTRSSSSRAVYWSLFAHRIRMPNRCTSVVEIRFGTRHIDTESGSGMPDFTNGYFTSLATKTSRHVSSLVFFTPHRKKRACFGIHLVEWSLSCKSVSMEAHIRQLDHYAALSCLLRSRSGSWTAAFFSRTTIPMAER